VVIGGAVLHFYEPRTPCEKMDAICVGLRELMEPKRQGVMAEVVQSGRISVGDRVEVYVMPARFYERASGA
jgi:MOSC domain-containing protein YiiM